MRCFTRSVQTLYRDCNGDASRLNGCGANQASFLPPTPEGHSAEGVEAPSFATVDHRSDGRIITAEQPCAGGEVSIRYQEQSGYLRCLDVKQKSDQSVRENAIGPRVDLRKKHWKQIEHET